VRDFDKLRRFNVEQLYDQYQSTLERGKEQKGKTVEQKEDVEETTKGKSSMKKDPSTADNVEIHDGNVEAID